MNKTAEIRSRHEVSAPFHGQPEGSKAMFNQAREDRGALLDEITRLQTLVTWADQNPESRGAIFRGLLEQRDDLLAALQHALTTIKALHGPVAWDIYERSSPEMQRYKAAIAAAS